MNPAYLTATLDFTTDRGSTTMDLRQSVDPGQLPFAATPFGVITAHNPLGQPASAADNEQRSAQLRARLEALGWAFIPATGRSPDGTHAEPGFAVLCTREALLALAREFAQVAIYWWDGEQFWVWPVEGEPVKLPLERDHANGAR